MVNEEAIHARELIALFRSDLNFDLNMRKVRTRKLETLRSLNLVYVDSMRLGVVASACLKLLERLCVLFRYIGTELVSIGGHGRSIGNAEDSMKPALARQQIPRNRTAAAMLVSTDADARADVARPTYAAVIGNPNRGAIPQVDSTGSALAKARRPVNPIDSISSDGPWRYVTMRGRLIPMTPRPEVNIPERAALVLSAHAAFLSDVLDAFGEWNNEHEWVATDGSPSVRERQTIRRHFGPAGNWTDEPSINLTGIVSLLLGSSSQYLEAIAALIEAHQVIASLPPLVRAVYEASGRITWVIAPLTSTRLGRTTARPRVARAMLVQLEDFGRAKEAAVSLDMPTAPKYGESWHRLKRDVIPGLFYESERVRTKSGKLILCEQALPGFKDAAVIFEKVHALEWKAAGVYDFLSNAAHPTPHMVMNSVKLQPNGMVRFEIDGTTSVTRQIRIAVLSFLHAWRITSTYLGLPAEPTEELLLLTNSLPE